MSVEKTERAVRWNIIALAFAGPALLATILYILWGLKPSIWCGVLIAGAKEAQVPAPQCTTVLLSLIGVFRDSIWILGGTLGLMLAAIVLAATGMYFKGGFGGASADIGASDAADSMVDAAVDKAAEIKGGG